MKKYFSKVGVSPLFMYSSAYVSSTGMILKLKMILLLVFILSLFDLVVIGEGQPGSDQTAGAQLDDQCRKLEKCFQCIQTPGCWWCKDKSLSVEERRCFGNISQSVPCTEVENPRGIVETVMLRKNADDSQKPTGNHTKILPQQVRLQLRNGEKLNISMEYTDEKNRPLDLYIVMDLSCSMKKHKETVASLALNLEQNLKRLTSNLRIGFGSFIDKPLPPFGYIEPKNTTCEGETVSYIPYGFKNHLTLTDNTAQFIDKVKASGIGTNIDTPEGTLEGLLQSIVCTQRIGWRTDKATRKLVVISTDGPFHFAGDGKLVGVVLPHDGVCYMDNSEMYTHATVLDYPSVSLVRQKIQETDVFVIFAVTNEHISVYEQLSKQLDPFSVTRGIDNDISIINVIETEYKKLVNQVTLLSEHGIQDYIDIKFYSRCPGETEFSVGNQCNDVGPGVNVSFEIEVKLKACPSNHDLWKSDIKIYPQSSSDDYMTINLMMLCGCDCEKANPSLGASTQRSNAECSDHGSLRCGICDCNGKWGGPHCNCTVEEVGGFIDKKQCIDRETGLECNRKGKCDSCGKCVCDPVNGNSKAFTGKYCECDNTECPREKTDVGLCNEGAKGGPQGQCKCRKCVCSDGFDGPTCQCPTSDASCHDAKSLDKSACNGKGKCKCGKCACERSFKGDYCEIQHAQIDGSCESARGETDKCVNCLVSTNGEKEADRRETCKDQCSQVALEFKEKLEEVPVHEEEHICKVSDEDEKGCKLDFIIRGRDIRTNMIQLEIESGEEALRDKCPTPPPIMAIIISIIAVMVLIGIGLLLLWKVVTHIQDRREYERFEKSIRSADWAINDNPLYLPTIAEFQNPAYVDNQESEFK